MVKLWLSVFLFYICFYGERVVIEMFCCFN